MNRCVTHLSSATAWKIGDIVCGTRPQDRPCGLAWRKGHMQITGNFRCTCWNSLCPFPSREVSPTGMSVNKNSIVIKQHVYSY